MRTIFVIATISLLFVLINSDEEIEQRFSSRFRNRYRNSISKPWVWGSSNRPRPRPRPHRPSRPKLIPQISKQSDSGKKECGTTGKVIGRIVGGREAEVGEFPWHVALMHKGLTGYEYFCGGAILNEKWIITAAHCMEGEKAEDLKIVVGTHDIRKRRPQDEYNVDQIINHENYRVGKGGELINDISLLRITNSIDLTSSLVNTVCLPAQDERFFKNLHVSGWGRTSERGLESDVLRTVQVFVHSNEECAKNLTNRFSATEMFCAGVRKGGKDACRGDSGGPIVKRKIIGENAKAYLAGVVSFGVGCAREGLSGVYTRVPTYIGWIQRHIK